MSKFSLDFKDFLDFSYQLEELGGSEALKKATEILKEYRVPFIINQNRYNIFDRTISHLGWSRTKVFFHC